MLNALDMATACGGTLINDAPPGNICFDTRKLQPGDWFVVLSGARDGHQFIPIAAEKDCGGVIGQRVPKLWDRGFIQVDSGLDALQAIARERRKQYERPVIGITGSAGKTTTRALIACALQALGNIHQTAGNFNNHIGLPLTIANAPEERGAWVLEMGMNALGEIALLQDIARPTVRLITNIGAAHVEGCGSIEGVAKAKGELFEGAQPSDICCINQDDYRVAERPLPPGVIRWSYGCCDGVDVQMREAKLIPDRLSTEVTLSSPAGPITFTLPAPGKHLAHNAMAAVTVGLALGLSPAQIIRGIERYEPVGDRLRPVSIGPVSVINDAYNANPMSMIASLELLHSLSEHGPVLILLGDMLELGPLEHDSHKEVLLKAKALGLKVGCVGPRFIAAAQELELTLWKTTEHSSEMAAHVIKWLAASDPPQKVSILLKGSRGLRMEKIEGEIRELFSAEGSECTP